MLPPIFWTSRRLERNSNFGECYGRILGVFAEDAQDFALDADAGGGGVDGGHLGVRGLEADHGAFAIEALEGGIGAVDQGDDDLSFAGGPGALDQDVVAGDDVLVTHGVSADFEGEDFAVTDDVRQGDALGGLNGFDWLTGGNSAHQGQAISALFAVSGREDVYGTAAVVGALQESLVLKIGDVFVDGGERTESQAAGDLLVGGRVAILLSEVRKEVDDLFLPPRDCHGHDCSE